MFSNRRVTRGARTARHCRSWQQQGSSNAKVRSEATNTKKLAAKKAAATRQPAQSEDQRAHLGQEAAGSSGVRLQEHIVHLRLGCSIPVCDCLVSGEIVRSHSRAVRAVTRAQALGQCVAAAELQAARSTLHKTWSNPGQTPVNPGQTRSNLVPPPHLHIAVHQPHAMQVLQRVCHIQQHLFCAWLSNMVI